MAENGDLSPSNESAAYFEPEATKGFCLLAWLRAQKTEVSVPCY